MVADGTQGPQPELDDQSPEHREEIRRLFSGLKRTNKWISSIYFYDERGSRLFERITKLPEYYLTRTELAIIRNRAGEMADPIGPGAIVIEPGSGAGEKIRLLLAALEAPVAYVPIEIARTHLEASAQALAAEFPDLDVLPVWADFTRPVELPLPRRSAYRRLVYFPGSTLGNFEPNEAASLLENFAQMVGEGGAALIGVDLAKDPKLIEAAYNDSEGVTAMFNLNMLAHLNRRFDADFNLDAFEHLAFYNREEERVEMHLRSLRKQVVHLAGERISLTAGETIHTESSYKYTPARFSALAARGGFRPIRSWEDPERMFSVRYLLRA